MLVSRRQIKKKTKREKKEKKNEKDTKRKTGRTSRATPVGIANAKQIRTNENIG
jgi:hypothetical protein